MIKLKDLIIDTNSNSDISRIKSLYEIFSSSTDQFYNILDKSYQISHKSYGFNYPYFTFENEIYNKLSSNKITRAFKYSMYIPEYEDGYEIDRHIAIKGKVKLINNKLLKLETNFYSGFLSDGYIETVNDDEFLNNLVLDGFQLFHQNLFGINLENESKYWKVLNKFDKLEEELMNKLLEEDSNKLEVLVGQNSKKKTNIKKPQFKVINFEN